MDAGDATPTTSQGRSAKRRLRNECEKRRRDSFNRYINELTDIVANGDRKMDKSNVLVKAIEFLKDRQAKMEEQNTLATEKLRCGSAAESHLCRALNCLPHHLIRAQMDIFDAGMFCLARDGDILHASPPFASLLGSTCPDVQSKSMFSFVSAEDAEKLRQFLECPGLRPKEKKRMDVLQVSVGALVLTGKWARIAFDRGKAQADELAEISGEEREVFVGVARAAGGLPAREFSLDNISSTHLPSGFAFTFNYNCEFTCVSADESGVSLLGFQPIDVVGTSGYSMIHVDDLDTVANAHKQLLAEKSMDIPVHRLRMASDGYMWLKCFASIESGDIKRIRCVYTPTNRPDTVPTELPTPLSVDTNSPKTIVHVTPMVRPPSVLVTPAPIYCTPSTPGTSSTTVLPSIHRHQGFPMSPALTEEGQQVHRSRSQSLSVSDRKRGFSENAKSPADLFNSSSSTSAAAPKTPERHFENVLEFFLQKSRELQEQVKRKRMELFKLSQQNGGSTTSFKHSA